jgi:catechol 2,3-dioxygenase
MTTVLQTAGEATLEARRAPLHVASVTLRARDMAALARFYETTMGLERIAATQEAVTLGAGGEGFLRIEAAPDAPAGGAGEAGLFHTAFLLPSRADLGRWLSAALEAGVPLEGASDHAVSEALYLSDPEGNGIEIYADRGRADWPVRGGQIAMTTARMDTGAVRAEGARAGAPTLRFPAGARIGHVHLKVGDAAQAEAFYAGRLGFDVTHRRPQAAFFAMGGYHHHLAANAWSSAGAGPRRPEGAGLAEVGLAVTDPALWTSLSAKLGGEGASDATATATDPWGTVIRLRQTV